MPAASCSRRAGPRWTRSTAFRPPWPSNSASRAAAARAPWAPPPRSGTSCACCTSSWACSTACTTAPPVKPQSAESIAAQLLRDLPRPAHRPAGAAGGQPQGRLHRAGQMGRAAATPTCGWTASSCPPPFPRIDRFKEHTWSCRWATWWCRPRTKAELRELLDQGAGLGKGVLHVLTPLDGLPRPWPTANHTGAGIGQVKVFSHQARLPGVRHQLPRAGPAPVQLQQQARLVPGSCVGTGL
jgi:excinuclease ABC subunit A